MTHEIVFSSHCCTLSIVLVYHGLFIHSIIDGHSGSSQFLAIINHGAMDVLVHVFWQIYVCIYVGYIPTSGISGLWGMYRVSLSMYY